MTDPTRRPAATDTYDITVSPRIDTPTRTISRSGNDFEVSTLGRVDAGEEVTATITAPDSDHTIEVRRPDEESPVYGLYGGEGGTVERTFDTGSMPGTDTELGPGTYVIAAVTGGDTLQAIGPFVTQGYRVSVDLPTVFDPGDSVDVTVDIEPISSPDTSLDGAELRIWSENTGLQTISLSAVDETTYEATITDPPSEPFNVYAAATRRVPEFTSIDSEAVGVSDKNVVEVAVDTLAVQAKSPLNGDPQFARPSVTDTHVICGGLDSELRAYERSAIGGETADWTRDRAGALSDSSPVVSDGTVYVGSGGGLVYALNANTGAVDWTFPDSETGATSAFTSTPAVSNGTVYIGANDGRLYALDAATGDKQWVVDAGGPIYAQPVVGDGAVYLTTASGKLLAVSTDGSGVAWRYQSNGEFGAAGPALDRTTGTIYTAGETVSAFTSGKSGGERQWSVTEFGGTVGSTPTVSSGTVYVGSADGTVYAINGDPSGTGSVEWTYTMAAPVAAQPTVVDGRVVVGSLDGRALVLDGGDGSPRAAEQFGGALRARPVVDGDRVYVAAADGESGGIASVEINRI